MPCSSASSGGMCSKHLGLQASAPPTPRGILLLCEDQADTESPESSCRFGQQAIVASSLSLSEDYKRQTHSMRVAWSSPGSTKNGTLGEGCGIVPARQGLTSVLPVHSKNPEPHEALILHPCTAHRLPTWSCCQNVHAPGVTVHFLEL